MNPDELTDQDLRDLMGTDLKAHPLRESDERLGILPQDHTIWVYESEPGHWETRDENGKYLDELDARRLCPAGHRYAPAYADLNWFELGVGVIEEALEGTDANGTHEVPGACGDLGEPAIWMSDQAKAALHRFLLREARDWIEGSLEEGYVEINRFLVFCDLAQTKEAYPYGW